MAQTELPLRNPPLALPGIGLRSQAGKVWDLLWIAYPGEVTLSELENVAFTKVTNRISKCRSISKPLGWDIKNRLEHTRFNGEPVTRSWYRIMRRAERDES